MQVHWAQRGSAGQEAPVGRHSAVSGRQVFTARRFSAVDPAPSRTWGPACVSAEGNEEAVVPGWGRLADYALREGEAAASVCESKRLAFSAPLVAAAAAKSRGSECQRAHGRLAPWRNKCNRLASRRGSRSVAWTDICKQTAAFCCCAHHRPAQSAVIGGLRRMRRHTDKLPED